jgi:hypothetical protein
MFKDQKQTEKKGYSYEITNFSGSEIAEIYCLQIVLFRNVVVHRSSIFKIQWETYCHGIRL